MRYLLLILLLYGCKSSTPTLVDNVIGEYELDEDFYGVGSEIKLLGDSTFIFDWFQGLISGRTTGSWNMKNNNLYLTSDEQPPSDRNWNYSICMKNLKQDSITIRVFDEEGTPLFGANCFVKGKGVKVVGSVGVDGEFKFPKVDVDKLRVEYVSHQSVNAYIRGADFIEIYMEESSDYYTYFFNSKWKFKNGELYDPKNKETYKKK